MRAGKERLRETEYQKGDDAQSEIRTRRVCRVDRGDGEAEDEVVHTSFMQYKEEQESRVV